MKKKYAKPDISDDSMTISAIHTQINEMAGPMADLEPCVPDLIPGCGCDLCQSVPTPPP